MRRGRHTIRIALGLAMLAGVSWGAASQRAPVLVPRGSVLLPEAPSAVVRGHQHHPVGEPACGTCHPRAQASGWASERLIPAMAECATCHEAAKQGGAGAPFAERCRACHAELKAMELPTRSIVPRPNLRFSHRAHQTLACGTCHPGAAAGAPASPVHRDVLGMEGCYRCHEQKAPRATTACRTCHLTTPDGRLATDWGDRRLTPPDWLFGPTHGVDWAGTHAPIAGADSTRCAACHTERFCRDCHGGKIRPRKLHPGDWVANHGANATLDGPRCQGCHRKQTDCVTCHRRAGIAPDSPPRARAHASPGRFHGQESAGELCRRARHDVTACVSCHSENSCLTCHQRINPHGGGFAKRCGPLAKRNSRSCLKCHAPGMERRCE